MKSWHNSAKATRCQAQFARLLSQAHMLILTVRRYNTFSLCGGHAGAIMSHRIDFAGLAHRKNSLTLHRFLTWNSIQSDKISPPCPPGLHKKQVSHPPTDRSGPGLGYWHPATLAWTWAMPVFKRKLSGHLLAKSHRYTCKYFFIHMRTPKAGNYSAWNC